MLRVHCAVSETTHAPIPQPMNYGLVRGVHVTVSQSYGGHSGGETPGPIPNPEAKPSSANGTALDRVWESRTPPNTVSRKGTRHHGSPFVRSQ
jgi:hypothetical protein